MGSYQLTSHRLSRTPSMSVGRGELVLIWHPGPAGKGRLMAQRTDARGSHIDAAASRANTGGAAGLPAAAIGSEEQRPALSGELSGSELQRWYWLRTELVELARQLGVSTVGGKAELTERLATVLDGLPAPAPTPRRRSSSAGQLEGELTVNTVIPSGQRCSEVLRGFFTAHIGAGFAFDGAMRSFIAKGRLDPG